MYMGEGGTIPFMGMLGEKFPGAQFMITGVLGPHSNAHGPNEFLHIPMGKRVTACVARVIADHHAASVRGETTGVAAVAGGEPARRARLLLSELLATVAGNMDRWTAARIGRATPNTQPRNTQPLGRARMFEGILGYIVGGAVIGILARFIKPGADPMGWILTILLGIAGAFIGGYVAPMLGVSQPDRGVGDRDRGRDRAAVPVRDAAQEDAAQA